MALATLSIDLEARLANLQQGLDKAGRMSQKTAADIERNFAGMRAGASAVGVAIGSAFSVAGIAAFFKTTIDGLDALNDLKDATGASIENLSALEDVALRTGTSMDTVGSSLTKFNKVLADAKAGSETANILKQIGLNAEELKKVDPAEALRQTAVALSKFADDGNKARIVQALFGKNVREVAPFLKDLATQTELLAKATTAQAEAAEKFNNQLRQFSKNFADASRVGVSALLPMLNDTLARVVALDRAFGGLGKGLLAGTLEFKQFRDAGEGVAYYTKQLKALDEQRAAEKRPLVLSQGASDFKAERDRLLKFQAFYREVSNSTLPNLGSDPQDLARRGRGPAASVGGIPDPDKTAVKVSEFDQYIERLKEAQAATLFLTEEEKARYETTFGKLSGYSGSQKAYALEVARTTDELKKLAEVVKPVMGPVIPEGLREKRDSDAKELKTLLDSLDSSKAAEAARQIELLNAALREGEIDAAKFAEGSAAVSERLKKLGDDANEFAKQAAANIQDALGETLKSTIKGDFDSIGKLWANLLIDMATQAAAAQLGKSLFGADFGKTGKLGGDSWAQQALDLFGSLGGRANGGPVVAGGMYEVNERGTPELLTVGGKDLLLMGNQGGRVTPFGKGAANDAKGARPINISIVNNIAAGVTRSEVLALAGQMQESNKVDIRKALRGARV